MKKITALTVAMIIFLISCLTSCGEAEELPYAVISRANVVLSVGDEYTLTAKVFPERYSDLAVEWTSSNPDVVTCEGGKLNALTTGSSVITASVSGGNAFSSTVTVKENLSNHANIPVGESMTIQPSEYSNLFEGEVTWSSSDPTVAQCTGGVVTALSAGSAVIRVCQGSDTVSVLSVTVYDDITSMVEFEAPELPVTLSYLSGKSEVEVQEFSYTVTEDEGIAANRLMVAFTVSYQKTGDIGGSQSKNTTGFYIELYSDEVGLCTTYKVESELLFIGQTASFSTNFYADISDGIRHFNIKLVPIE